MTATRVGYAALQRRLVGAMLPGTPCTITSTSNRRIVDACKLAQRKWRRRRGGFLVEGIQLLTRGLDANAVVREVFYCEESIRSAQATLLLSRCREVGAEMFAVSPHVMRRLTTRDGTGGIVATFALLEHRLDDVHISGDGLVVVLDRAGKPGNVGMLIRTADAVGAKAVVLAGACADPFHPEAVRATMGSLFSVPVVQALEPGPLIDRLRRGCVRVLAADPHEGCGMHEDIWQGSVALFLGSEGEGLSDTVRRSADLAVRLPIVGEADSLNVAVTGGILMYAWLSQRLSVPSP